VKILATLVILFILILLISFLSVRLELKYLRKKNNDHFSIKISLLRGLLKYKLDIPKINLNSQKTALKVEAELEGGKSVPDADIHKKYPLGYLYQQFMHWYPEIKEYFYAGKYLLKRVVPSKIIWQTEIGLSDAAITGMSVGILWAVKSALLSNIYRYFAIAPRPPEISIIPKFNEKTLVINIDCIFNIKIGYVIITALKFFQIYSQHVLHKMVCYLRGVFGGRTTAPN